MDTVGVVFLKQALSPLCGSLHDAFSTCVKESTKIRADHQLIHTDYNSLGADLTRGLAHRHLIDRSDLGGWTIIGQHRLRGQLLLRREMVRVRFLHEPRSIVPPPGRNSARKAYYRNVPLGQANAYDTETSNLVAVWRVVDPETSSVSFRIVRPLSDRAQWSGSETPVDLDFVLPDLGADLDALEFEQLDEGLAIQFPETDEEPDEGAASNDVG